MPQRNIEIYIFTKNPGGEFIWLERISKKLNAPIKLFWKEDDTGPNLTPSGFLNYFVYHTAKIIGKYNNELARGFYGIFGTYTYKVKQDHDRITIISSTHIPIPRGSNLLAYIHTPSRLLTIGLADQFMNRNESLLSTAYRYIWKKLYYLLYTNSIKRAELVLTNSENIRKRLNKFFNVDSKVIYPSVDVERFHCKDQEKYFFYPSRISPQKRQLMALEAFCKFCKERTDFKLILATTTLKLKENRDYLEKLEKYAHLTLFPEFHLL